MIECKNTLFLITCIWQSCIDDWSWCLQACSVIQEVFHAFGHYIVSEWTVILSKWSAILFSKLEYGLKTVVDKNESKLLCYWHHCAATKAPSVSAAITAIFQGWDRINCADEFSRNEPFAQPVCCFRAPQSFLWPSQVKFRSLLLSRLDLCHVSSPSCWAAGVSLHCWMSCWSRFYTSSLNMK